MSARNKSIQKVALVFHPKLAHATSEVGEIRTFFESQGISVYLAKTNSLELTQKLEQREFDLMVAIGGDGTMLRAGHLTAPNGVPLLGINMGRFGFLMQLTREDWKASIPRLIKGQYKIENRMMLQAEHWREGNLQGTFQVINEVVVCRGQVVRPIRIQARVDGYSLASYVADGLIAATPTGSTAYALAVGGPIMPPELRNILIVPVAPHLSMDHAVILPEGASVEMTVTSDHQSVMSVDGHAPVALKNGDMVRVTSSEYRVRFVVFQDPGYFYRNLSNYMEQNPSIGGLK
jgi:NAD+ kinase